MAGEKTTQPQPLSRVLGLAKTSLWAREEATRAAENQAAAGYRIFPEGSSLFAELLVLIGPESSQAAKDLQHQAGYDASYQTGQGIRAVTAAEPFEAAGFSFDGRDTSFSLTFFDRPMVGDEHGALPQYIWHLTLGTDHPKAKVQELDAAGTVTHYNMIGRLLEPAAGQPGWVA